MHKHIRCVYVYVEKHRLRIVIFVCGAIASYFGLAGKKDHVSNISRKNDLVNTGGIYNTAQVRILLIKLLFYSLFPLTRMLFLNLHV